VNYSRTLAIMNNEVIVDMSGTTPVVVNPNQLRVIWVGTHCGSVGLCEDSGVCVVKWGRLGNGEADARWARVSRWTHCYHVFFYLIQVGSFAMWHNISFYWERRPEYVKANLHGKVTLGIGQRRLGNQ